MSRLNPLVLAALALLVSGCDLGLDDAECLLDRQCATGQVCLEGSCVASSTDAGSDVAADVSALCGNGVLDDGESCDDGDQNGDRVPNACRMDCTLPSCGDGVVDDAYDEACDDGDDNSDEVPNACRTTCAEPSCGDGVVDDAFGEACEPADDGIRCQVGCEVYYASLCAPCTATGSPCGEREEDMRCLAEAEEGADGVCSPECETRDDCPLGRDCLYSAEFDIGVCLLEVADCFECAETEFFCDDGEDEDCDGRRDCDDPDCADAGVCADEICDNERDDDDDGDVDCDDDECADSALCGGCTPDFVAGEGRALWTATITDADDLVAAPPCAPLADRGFIVNIEVPTAGRWRFDAAGSGDRVAIAIADDTCGAEVSACSAQAELTFFGSLYLDLRASDVVTLVVAPLDGSPGDRVVLNAIPDEVGPARCSNGIDDDGDGASDCDDPRCSELGRCRACDDDEACGASAVCQAGECACPAPTGPTTWCGGECVNLQSDPFNCGSCDNVCPTFACRAGRCQTASCTSESDVAIVTRDAFEGFANDCYASCGVSVSSLGCLASCFLESELSPACTNCFVGNGLCAAIFCDGACSDLSGPACGRCIEDFCESAFETCAIGAP